MHGRLLVLMTVTCWLAAMVSCEGETNSADGASDTTGELQDGAGGEPGTSDATGSDGGLDRPQPSDPTMALIHGMIMIPPVHPRNIRHQTLKPSVHSHVEYFLGEADAPLFQELEQTLIDPKDLKFHRVFRGVDVVPIPPPDDSTEDFTFEGKHGPIQTHLWSYHTKVKPDGSFQLQVAPYKYGYYISASADRVRMKERVLGEVSAGDAIHVDLTIKGTLIANYALELDEQEARTKTNADIDAQFESDLDKAVLMTRERFAKRLMIRDWYVLSKLGALPPLNALITPQTDWVLDLSPPYFNLMSLDEITGLNGHTHFGFDSPGALDVSLKMKGFTIVPQTSATLTDDTGHVTLDVPDGEYVELLFFPPVRSVGMKLQNGSDASNASAQARRAFQLEAFDRQEGLIATYRWYTNQDDDGAGFYGVTSAFPIRRVRLTMTGTGAYSIDDLAYATTKVLSLDSDLGWRATGDWARKTVEDDGIPNTGGQYPGAAGDFVLDFDHEHRHDYGQTGDEGSDQCTSDNYWSGGTYWVVGYGDGTTATTSTLSSPAFTVGNLLTDADDNYVDPDTGERVFDYWIAGDRSDIDEMMTLGDETSCLIDDSEAPMNAFTSLAPDGPDLDWNGDGQTTGPGSATMRHHWSHVHWQSYADLESDAVTDAGSNSERRVEYSTDNGATWRRAWWFPDSEHRGPNGVWWNAHMHPFPDSDLVVSQHGGTCTGTDFDKDGDQDYDKDVDGDGDGYNAGDDDDCRQWDTEWYYEYVEPPYECIDDAYCDSPQMAQALGCKLGACLEEDFPILGMSVVYRFVFETQGNHDPSTCYTTDCVGWAIDDVAFNSDDEDIGYFTNFDHVIDPNAQ